MKQVEDGSYSGTIPAMMRKVGLKLKTIISSVSQDQEALSKLSDKVLGCLYDPKNDLIGVKFSFNPSKKKKGAKTSQTSPFLMLILSTSLHTHKLYGIKISSQHL